MSDQSDQSFDPEDWQGVEPRMAQLPRSEIRKLEKDRRDLARTQAELELARRELAFAKAGIDTNDPAAKYFVKGYDGELDPESIRAEAVAARLIGGQSQITDAELAGHDSLVRASAGAVPSGSEDEISRALAEVARIPWRDADQARDEIMRIVGANDIKLHVPGA